MSLQVKKSFIFVIFNRYAVSSNLFGSGVDTISALHDPGGTLYSRQRSVISSLGDRMGLDLEIECPHCRENFTQNAREISVRGERNCPLCQGKIEFSGSYIFGILRRMNHRDNKEVRQERS